MAVTDQDQFGNYRAYLFTPPYPVPPFTSGNTQVVAGNPNTLGPPRPANTFAYYSVGNVLYFTANGSTWTAISGGTGGASFLSGSGSPVGTVTATAVGQTYADISNPAAVNF